MHSLDRARLAELMAAESAKFAAQHPRSGAAWERAQGSLLGGVPMAWMTKWASPFPPFVERAEGAHFWCLDGHAYVDFCLGDTGAMTGHSPPASMAAVQRQLRHGITHMLPTVAAAEAGEALQARFGLPFWQFTLSATDANRHAIRLCRQITGRSKILVHNGCYHGSVDETFAALENGRVVPRRGNVGPPVDPAETTRVVEFNDAVALEAALADGQVAAVLLEPALTNIGIVLPDPGYHDAVRRLTRDSGTLLIVDETHTICTGPGGYTRAFGLQPDLFVIGKPIGSGIPAGAYGFTREVADGILASTELEDVDVGGIGGTLAGYALSLSAIAATLTDVLTDDAYGRMIPLAQRWAAGVDAAIHEWRVPWHVTRLGCRAEYHFLAEAPRNGGQAGAAMDFELERFLHLYALNRGVLLTPFHNMALMSPATTSADVDRHTQMFREALAALFA